MDTPSFNEYHISQIPALQLLQKLGYKYLSPSEADNLRGGKTSLVLLIASTIIQEEDTNLLEHS